MSHYGYSKKLEIGFEQAVEEVKKALLEEGFGILMEIDVQQKMKEKLNQEMDKYLILGACNPQLAAKALEAETEIGLLLPCNVIVYVKDGETFVSVILPSVAMAFVENESLTCIKEEAEHKLKTALDNLKIHEKLT